MGFWSSVGLSLYLFDFWAGQSDSDVPRCTPPAVMPCHSRLILTDASFRNDCGGHEVLGPALAAENSTGSLIYRVWFYGILRTWMLPGAVSRDQSLWVIQCQQYVLLSSRFEDQPKSHSTRELERWLLVRRKADLKFGCGCKVWEFDRWKQLPVGSRTTSMLRLDIGFSLAVWMRLWPRMVFWRGRTFINSGRWDPASYMTVRLVD